MLLTLVLVDYLPDLYGYLSDKFFSMKSFMDMARGSSVLYDWYLENINLSVRFTRLV